MVPLSHVLALSIILFVIGAAGFVLRTNIITIFMCIELMLNAVNLAFIAFSRQLGNLDGQLFVFFVIVVAAAEAAVGSGDHHFPLSKPEIAQHRGYQLHEDVRRSRLA